jgi:outer membrane protein insertion porin family
MDGLHPRLRAFPHLTVLLSAMLGCLLPSAVPVRASIDVDFLRAYEGFLVTAVEITGQDITKEYVIRREIRIEPGDLFRVADARADLIRLENLGIFSSQRITAVAADSTVALWYVVREIPWIVPYPIVDYTEQNGWSFGLGVASVNLLGRGMILAGSGSVGGLDAFSAYYGFPWITGNHISAEAFLSDDRRDDTLNGFQEHSREFSPGLGRWIGDSGRVAGTVSWFQMNADRDSITISPDRRDDYLRVGVRVGFDNRDTWRNPRRGWNNEVLLLWNSASAFGGPGDWPLIELDVRRYQPVAGWKNTLVIGGLFSYQDGQADSEVPRYLQYRMGGANSIRGYNIEVLGRELVGKNQMIVTLEYQREAIPLRELRIFKWSVSAGLDFAAFFDAGNAWNDPREFNTDRIRSGFGAGLRILVPGVYEIRTDVAVGEDGGVHFHLGVGDKLTAQRSRLR